MRNQSVLPTILASKQEELTLLRTTKDAWQTDLNPRTDFIQQLRRKEAEPLRLFAEIKFRSPSAGEMSRVLSAQERALIYAECGVSMISVLTDGPFFGGSYETLQNVRMVLEKTFGKYRPGILCKEFILDEIQLHRAKSAGADGVLLIVRIVSKEQLKQLVDTAIALQMAPLIEVATLDELEQALCIGSTWIGVNSRDLDTLVMDQERAAHVISRIPQEIVRVHLSGLKTPHDVAELSKTNIDAALIGESLMRMDDPRALLTAMLNVC